MDIIEVVNKLSSFGLIRTNKVSGDWYQCYCPFHSSGNEKKPSFGILIRDRYQNGRKYPAGFGHCFACSYANPLKPMVNDMVKQHTVSSEVIQWINENITEVEADIDSLLDNDLMQSIIAGYAVDDAKNRLYAPVKYVSEEELASYRFTVPYMYERKLTDEIIEKFDVGFDKDWIPPGRKKPVPCITFPVHDSEGRTLFFCRRSIEGKLYNYPTGVTKPVYGIDMIPQDCKQVIICESIINALTLWTWGYVAVALMGTGNQYQIQQLKRLGVAEYIICMDGDDAGRHATDKLKNALRQIAIITRINMIDGKDVNDLDKETFDKLYKERY